MRFSPALSRRGYVLGESRRRGHALGLGATIVFAGAVGLHALSTLTSRSMCMCGETKERIARSTVVKYVCEALPSWQLAHPDATCPVDLTELNEWMNNKDIRDPWGRDYRWDCRSQDGVAMLVTSAGPDEHFGTADDIGSDL
jgi:Type II secretion system (T2SS), protein G